MSPNEIRDEVMGMEMTDAGWDLRNQVIALCELVADQQRQIERLEKRLDAAANAMK